MGWLLRKICDHAAKNLYIETNTFSDGTCSNRVLCRLCGKEIVPEEHFDILKAVLTTASTGQPDKPSAS